MEQPEPDIWRDLAVLLAVGEAKTSAAAAQALGISQDAITTRIAQLETRMGSELILRHGNDWSLTDAGLGLAHQARSIAELVERRGRPTLKGMKASPALVLCCPDLLFEYLLLPIWYRIQDQLPEQPIQLRTASNLTDQSVRGNDLTLCLGHKLRPNVVGHEVGQVGFRLYGHRDLFDTEKTQQPPCHFAVDTPQLAVPDLVWPKLGPTRRVSCPNLTMVAAAVKAGQGIGILPEFIANQDPSLVPLDGVELSDFTLWILSSRASVLRGEHAAQLRRNATLLRQLLSREMAALLQEPSEPQAASS